MSNSGGTSQHRRLSPSRLKCRDFPIPWLAVLFLLIELSPKVFFSIAGRYAVNQSCYFRLCL